MMPAELNRTIPSKLASKVLPGKAHQGWSSRRRMEEVPQGEGRTVNAIEIREHVLEILQTERVRTNSQLPLLDEPFHVRPATDVAQRIIILYALTGLANGADPGLLASWLKEHGIYDRLDADEKHKFELPLSDSALAEVSWRQEALYALGWAANLVEEFALPTRECDLEPLFPLIPPEVDVQHFVKILSLRPASEIALQTDRHYCIHWAAKHPPRLFPSVAQRMLKMDVVIERRHAFEWLLGTEPWNDVALDT